MLIPRVSAQGNDVRAGKELPGFMTLLQTTVGRMFQSTAARFPERICLETAEAVYTYAQTERLTNRLAKKLFDAGFRKGSRLGLWCKDTPEFLCLYLSMEKLGCIPVLLNTALTGSEMAALLRKAEAEALFLDDGFKGVDFPKEAAAQNIENTFYIPDFFRSLPDVSEAELQALYGAVLPSDPDVIIFTSGTSGISKGVLTTHLSPVNVAKAQADTISMTEEDKCCVAIPLFHCFGLTGVALAALCCGASLYFPIQRRTRLLLEAVSVHRCTVFSAVPTLYSAIMARPDLADFDLSSLRTGYIGGSLYTPEFFRRVEETLNMRLAPSLGQTEATAGLTFISPDEDVETRIGSVGRFLAGLEGKIQNLQTGKPQPVGEGGE
ncbi:MAG: acyl--CoA ligase, partial [Mailhella sp.]|nr:acyl--CoA ligase [Mailhella sp.]